jgi:hypothetical protein
MSCTKDSAIRIRSKNTFHNFIIFQRPLQNNWTVATVDRFLVLYEVQSAYFSAAERAYQTITKPDVTRVSGQFLKRAITCGHSLSPFEENLARQEM